MPMYENNLLMQQILASPSKLTDHLDSLTNVTVCSRPKGMLKHVGLKLEFNDPKITTVYLHTNPANDRHLSLCSEFADGKKIDEQANYPPSLELTQRLALCLNQQAPYSIFNNCQHLVNRIVKGIVSSEQLKGAGFGAAAGLGLAHLGKATPGEKLFAALVGGAIGLALTKN